MTPYCGATLGSGVACGGLERRPPSQGTSHHAAPFVATMEERRPSVARFSICPREFYSNIFRFLKCHFRLLKQKTMWSKQNEINSADRLRLCKLGFIVRTLKFST